MDHERNTTAGPVPDTRKITRRINRAQLLSLAGAGVTMAAVPGFAHASGVAGRMEFPFYPATGGSYTPENLQDILNVLLTMQRFGVAVNAGNLQGAIDPAIHPLQLSDQKASLIANMARADFLQSLGARSLTDTYTVGGPAPFTAASLKRAETVTTIFVGAYMTAAREFAELGQPTLVKWAFQAGAGLAAERVLSRAIMNIQNVPDTDPPLNKAFETDLFVHVRDAYALMTRMGLFGGLPVRLPYPSQDIALALAGSEGSKVLQKVPNNATVSVNVPGDVTKERM